MPFHRHLHRWLGGYARQALTRAVEEKCDGPRHVLFALCDHYEPLWGNAGEIQGKDRVQRWVDDYGRVLGGFTDADGLPPRHTFFFPGEQYRPHYLEGIGALVRRGYGELEMHLHHDGDDAQRLAHDLVSYTTSFTMHGHLSRDSVGAPRYAFIHGNWTLANCRADGRYCGVDSELEVLFRTGCYADFTFPSAPDETQPSIVNQIYWPTGDPRQARSHEQGVPARVGTLMHDRILMFQGPLCLARRERGLGLRIESGALTALDPGTPSRIKSWVERAIHVAGRPDWIFVKVHTHGAPESQADSLLGEPGRRLHQELQRSYNDGRRFILHYVTAREMFNIAVAGMQGMRGDPGAYRNFALEPPPLAA